MTELRVASSWATTLYTPNELAMVYRPLDASAVPQRAVIVVHGRGADATQFRPGTAHGDHVQHLAHAGRLVLSVNAAGSAPWQNAAAVAAILGGLDWLVTAGVPTGAIDGLAYSGGGGNLLQAIKEHPTRIRRAVLFCPQSNTNHFYNNGNGAWAAEILAAHGGNYANTAGRRIAGDGDFSFWRNRAIRIYHGTADATIPLSLSEAFVDGVDDQDVTLVPIAGAGHSDLFDDVAVAETAAFLDAA